MDLQYAVKIGARGRGGIDVRITIPDEYSQDRADGVERTELYTVSGPLDDKIVVILFGRIGPGQLNLRFYRSDRHRRKCYKTERNDRRRRHDETEAGQGGRTVWAVNYNRPAGAAVDDRRN